jgi:hypothetical protein
MDQETKTLIKSRLELLKIAHRDELLSKTAFWLLACLASLVNSEGQSALSLNLLSEADLGCSRRVLKRALQELVEYEYVTVRRHKGWPRYSFNINRMELTFFEEYPTISFYYKPDHSATNWVRMARQSG